MQSVYIERLPDAPNSSMSGLGLVKKSRFEQRLLGLIVMARNLSGIDGDIF